MGGETSKEQEQSGSKESTSRPDNNSTDQTENTSTEFIRQQMLLLECYEQNFSKNQCPQKDIYIASHDTHEQNKIPNACVSSLSSSQCGDPDNLVQINLQLEQLENSLLEQNEQNVSKNQCRQKEMHIASHEPCEQNKLPNASLSSLSRSQFGEQNVSKSQCRQKEMHVASHESCEQNKTPNANLPSLSSSQFGDPDYLVQINLQLEELSKSLLEPYEQNVSKNQCRQKELHVASHEPCEQNKLPNASLSSLSRSQFGEQNVSKSQCREKDMHVASHELCEQNKLPNASVPSLSSSQCGDPDHLDQINLQLEEVRKRLYQYNQRKDMETVSAKNCTRTDSTDISSSAKFIHRQNLLLEQYKQNVPEKHCQLKEMSTANGDHVLSLSNSQYGNSDHLVQKNLQEKEDLRRLKEQYQQKVMETTSTKHFAETSASAKFVCQKKPMLQNYKENISKKQCQEEDMPIASSNHIPVPSLRKLQYSDLDHAIQKNLQELEICFEEQEEQGLSETATAGNFTRKDSIGTSASAESIFQQKPLLEYSVFEKKSWQKLPQEQHQQNLSEVKHQQRLLAKQYKEKVVDKECQNSFKEEKQEEYLKNISMKQSQEKISEKEHQENKLKESRQKKYMKEIMKLHNLAVAQTKCFVPVNSRYLSHSVLRHHLATNWNQMAPNKTFIRIVIQEDSDEFRTVKKCFKSTTQKTFHVVKIERIQNPFLLGCYMLKKLELENMFGAHNVKEMILFRGTFERFVNIICENNFDWKFCGDSKRRGYGKGIYFSPISFFANDYSNKNSTHRVMFLVRVLTSKITEGNENMEIPPPIGSHEGNNNCNNSLRFDTTKRTDGKILVKYSDNEFYPEYLIHYTIEPQPEMK